MMMGKILGIPSPFQCCRSHDISVVPTDPPPPPPPAPSSKPHHSSLRRHVSSAFTCACRRRSSSTNSDDDDQITKTPPNLSGSHDDVSQPHRGSKKKKKKSKPAKTLTRLRMSTSSAESESLGEIEELEETETLICSSSNTDGDAELESIGEKPYKSRRKMNLKKKKKKKKKRNRGQKWAESSSPARLSGFQRLIPCSVEGKIRESFAVVKKSEDPLEDFKRSMMEMIMEKEMFEQKDLEQLLHCLLSLNDREFHHIIVQAFSDIWHSLFSNSSTCRSTF